MASSAGGRAIAALFVGLGALSVYACAGDRLVLPTFDEAGAAKSDASCTQCGDECVDSTTDPRHCGGCGTKCASGSACVAGQCSLTCPTGFVNCAAGTCIDPLTSAEHCGATGACDGSNSGAACTAAQTCKGGACVGAAACPTATPDACGAGASAVCTSLKTDPTHCGDCATACAAGSVCNDGTCGIVCGALQTTCGTGATATCHTPTGPSDCCGTACAVDKDCTAGGCAACIPTVTTTTVNAVPPNPALLKVTCVDAAFATIPCPVVKCGGITYWVFAYGDNRTSYGVVGYDRNGGVVKPLVEKPGARYINSITVNAGAANVTLTGQDGLTVVMPFTAFRLP